MAFETKIATCCYCGTRAALVLTGTTRHELACSGCGAPLHELKALRPVQDRQGSRELVRRPATPAKYVAEAPKKPKKAAYKGGKRRKSRVRWVLEEAFDLIEDVFD